MSRPGLRSGCLLPLRLTRAPRVFPPRTDPCSNLSPLTYPGGDGVIDMELLSVIRRWHYRDHFSIREISRRTGLSRNTVRKYLRSDTVEPKFNIPDRPSKLDPYADKLSQMLRQEALPNPQRRNLET